MVLSHIRKVVRPWLLCSVAIVLSSAALAKSWVLWAQPVGGVGVFGDRQSQSFIVAFEFMLAALLVTGRLPVVTWSLATVTFIVFLVVSAWSASTGLSCGCFGVIQIPAWFLVSFDGVIILMLLAVGPGSDVVPSRLRLYMAAPLFLLCFGALGVLRGHGVASSIVSRPLTVHKDRHHFGSMYLRKVDVATVDFTIANSSTSTIFIESVSTSCSCTLAAINKAAISPGDRASLQVYLAWGARAGNVSSEIQVESSTGQDLLFHVSGKVVPLEELRAAQLGSWIDESGRVVELTGNSS